MAQVKIDVDVDVSITTLDQCFELARERMRAGVRLKKEQKSVELEEFLKSAMNIDDLKSKCERANEASTRHEKSEQFLTTLSRVQGVLDGLMSPAPESISLVWFGISSFISLGTMVVEVQRRIYGTCNSIATMMELCLQLESHPPTDGSNDTSSLWSLDIPELVYLILDFLWHVRSHSDTRGIKKYAKAVKESFTGALDEKATSLQEQYQKVVDKNQALFQKSMQINSENVLQGLKDICKVSADIADIAYNHMLKDEFDRQKNKIKISSSHGIHFNGLKGRLNDIINKREVVKWLLEHETYTTWKGVSNSVNVLCIEAPRGHGKSTAMMRLHRDLETCAESGKPKPIVAAFFFKKGDKDIQLTQTALESILFQLLHHDSIQRNWSVIEKIIGILNPEFGTDKEHTAEPSSGENFLESPKVICQTIQKISAVIPHRVYLMLDALDECQDMKTKDMLRWLKSTIVGSSPEDIRIIVSARSTIDIRTELESAGAADFSALGIDENRPNIAFIEIEKSQNSHDLQAYLKDEITEVLSQLIAQSSKYFAPKVDKLVANIKGKANGDFTSARLIIAHLKQPSKLPIEKKIEKLPDSIADIYMANLEALTPGQQELVVTALKWIVWGVSNISIVEIADHYREIYWGTQANGDSNKTQTEGDANKSQAETPDPGTDESQESTAAERDASDALPFNEENLGPDIKEIIYYLREAGRDLCKYDPATGLVGVDISVREWIRKDTDGQGSLKESAFTHGFRRFKDDAGYTVFQFALTPSFVKYGDILSPLFSMRDAHMSIAIATFRTLNNKAFQERYMPWDPEWDNNIDNPPKRRPRYEIEHWQDHIEILQQWWNKDSISDPWWSDLLKEIDIFLRPENWFRWNIQRKPSYSGSPRWQDVDLPDSESWYKFHPFFNYSFDKNAVERCLRYFQEPIHFASELGLNIIIDYLISSKRIHSPLANGFETPDQQLVSVLHAKILAICKLYATDNLGIRRVIDRGIPLLPNIPRGEGIELLRLVFEEEFFDGNSIHSLVKILTEGWDHSFRIAWLAKHLVSGLVDNIELLMESKEEEEAKSFLDKYNRDSHAITAAMKEIIAPQLEEPSINYDQNIPDGLGRTPLYIAAMYPETVKRLIGYGFDINAPAIKGRTCPLLFTLLYELGGFPDRYLLENPIKPEVLQTIQILLSEGAELTSDGFDEATALHYAAGILDINLFRKVCQARSWDVLAEDERGRTPMHYLFSRKPSESQIASTMEIFTTLIRMGKDARTVVNAQDEDSESPLAYAVRQGFQAGIKWLVDQEVDLHDDNEIGENCFHHLAEFKGDAETIKGIANLLLDAGVDWKKKGSSIRAKTPFQAAIANENETLTYFLIDCYEKLKLESGDENLFSTSDGDGVHIFCDLAPYPFSQELTEWILKATGGLDVASIEAGGGNPVLRALTYQNYQFAEYLLNLGVHASNRDPSGLNAVDECFNHVGYSPAPEEMAALKRILELLFQRSPISAAAALRLPVFHDDSVLSTEERQQMVSKLDYQIKDEYGWTALDILRLLDPGQRTMLPESLFGYDLSTAQHSRPSKIVSRSRFDSFIDSSGLTLDFAFMRSGQIYQGFGADNPAPLSRKTTYYEVTVGFREEAIDWW
ncbi:hypothetical protein ABW19_dt0201367 [Dactylella cylindrospora]|nr:hypothetical protein ABW19_dt0201367 [Dactylella cylindrospora]